jgi:hypothetical protein
MKTMNPLTLPPLLQNHSQARQSSRRFSRLGAVLGLQVFFSTVLLPLMLFGGRTSQRLAERLFGIPETPGFGLNASIVLGVATIGGATLFATLGGVAAASVLASSQRLPR